jgi:hypothetical protein
MKAALSKAWSALGSMQLFCYLSVTISGWFMVLLVFYPNYIKAVSGMNDRVLLRWLLDCNDPASDPVRGWLVVLCAMMFALAINLSVCVIEDAAVLGRLGKKGVGARQFLARTGILLMHLSYIVVILGHFTTSVAGFRVQLDLAEGGKYRNSSFPFEIGTGKITTVPDPMTGANMVSAVKLVLNGGGFADRKINMKVKHTIWVGKYLLSLNYRTQKNEGSLRSSSSNAVRCIPVLRVAENPGLKVLIAGGMLFFAGIVIRMLFRNY